MVRGREERKSWKRKGREGKGRPGARYEVEREPGVGALDIASHRISHRVPGYVCIHGAIVLRCRGVSTSKRASERLCALFWNKGMVLFLFDTFPVRGFGLGGVCVVPEGEPNNSRN